MSRETPGFDFFTTGELPAPDLPAAELVALAKEHWGLVLTLEPLGSQQDLNFLAWENNEIVGVLKVTNPAFSITEIDAQEAAAERIAQKTSELRIATTTQDAANKPRVFRAKTSVGTLIIRLISHLPGGTLSGSRYLAPAVVAQMGTIAAKVSTALAGFEHHGLDRVLQWNPQVANRIVDLLAKQHPDPVRSAQVIAETKRAWKHLEQLADLLPTQAVHLDLTDDNLVLQSSNGRQGKSSQVNSCPILDGVIDFGDVSRSWAVAELAITISSILHHSGAEPSATLPAIRAFNAIRPLSVAEIAAIWPIVVLRAAVLVVSGEHQVLLDGSTNAYAAAGIAREWEIFEQAISVPITVMTATIADALEHSIQTVLELSPPTSSAPKPETEPEPTFQINNAVCLDTSVTSASVDTGGWLLAEKLEQQLAIEALDNGAEAAWLERGKPRLTESLSLSPISSASTPLGIDIWFSENRSLPPLDGFTVEGAEQTATRLLAPARTRIRVRSKNAEHLVRPEYAIGWLAVTSDPAPALGLTHKDHEVEHPAEHSVSSVQRAAAELITRRNAAFAEVQEHYYKNPPQIERGWREHLIDTEGRVYLDMVNNVTPLGHGHPKIAAAVSQQLLRLNTNSRFNYSAVVEFSERLANLLPDPLDTVFLVNSGSEAADLAIRVALAATGRRDVVSLLEAYHGWTYASDAVSTSIADNPNALATRPDWVHTVDAPNPYRGKYRGAAAVKYAPEAAAKIHQLAAEGREPAAFIAETFYGNAGGIPLPDGYLREVYSAVRATGGLAIADEVQAGYGRLGEWFWGFQQQGVVPDIVAVAKAMGNGHPLGAVITTHEIAARFRTQGYFFSSTGGSPASSVAGIAVLDAYISERVQENARETGGYLKQKLQDLSQKHQLIGAIHGIGLYLGVEFVRDRKTLEPATEETAAICNRLLELGVIMQPTGDHQNVLKTKPPLVITRESVDFFVKMLDRVLTEGW